MSIRIRARFPATANGTAQRKSTHFLQADPNVNWANRAPTIMSARRERIPLQGFATSTAKRWPAASCSTGSGAERIPVPLRITGTPIVFSTTTLTWDMMKRSGNATIMSSPGNGIAKIRKAIGNDNSLRNSQPSIHQTDPARTIITLTNPTKVTSA